MDVWSNRVRHSKIWDTCYFSLTLHIYIYIYIYIIHLRLRNYVPVVSSGTTSSLNYQIYQCGCYSLENHGPLIDMYEYPMRCDELNMMYGAVIVALAMTTRVQYIPWFRYRTRPNTTKCEPFEYILGCNSRNRTCLCRILYSISQEICTRFLLCCALLWLNIDWFSHIHQAYFTGTVAI